MGRPKLLETKPQVAGRVAPRIKAAVKAVATKERRTESQTIELLLEQSPKVRAYLKNGNRQAAQPRR